MRASVRVGIGDIWKWASEVKVGGTTLPA